MSNSRKTILITGSTGLIGSALTERLQRHYDVIGFDVKAPKSIPEGSRFVEVDLTSDASVQQGLEQVSTWCGDQIASVIHLAAYYDFAGDPSPLYEKITVEGTRRLLHALKSMQVEQLIFSSTMLVHQPCSPGQTIDESSPVEPSWAYPQSKVRTEKLLSEEHGDIPVVIFRIAGVYDDYCHSLPLSHQIQRILERQITSKLYPGDLDAGQAFLHRDDLLQAFELAIENRSELPNETVLLLGEPDTMSYGELQQELGRLLHQEDWPTNRIPKPIAKVGAWLQDHNPFGEDPFIKPWMVDRTDDHYALDISRSRQMLGWEPRHRLRETLVKMITALSNNPEAWYREHNLTIPSGGAEALISAR